MLETKKQGSTCEIRIETPLVGDRTGRELPLFEHLVREVCGDDGFTKMPDAGRGNEPMVEVYQFLLPDMALRAASYVVEKIEEAILDGRLATTGNVTVSVNSESRLLAT